MIFIDYLSELYYWNCWNEMMLKGNKEHLIYLKELDFLPNLIPNLNLTILVHVVIVTLASQCATGYIIQLWGSTTILT